MSNIYEGRADVREANEFFGKDLDVIYAKDRDNPQKPCYPHWDSTVHPETGEKLTAVKGYCDPRDHNKCYYAEYRDKEGNSYYYIDTTEKEAHGKTIGSQLREDRTEYEAKTEQANEQQAGKQYDAAGVEIKEEQQNSYRQGYSRGR